MATGNPFTTAQAPQTMAPTDYTVEQNQVLRQQQLADLLRKQAMEQSGGTEMVSGWAVKKSPLEGVNKIAQALGSRYLQNQADEKQLALATKLREQGVSDMQGVMGAMQGTPEKVTDFAPDTFDAQDAANMQQAGAMQNVQPAIAPDRRQAMALALQSQTPMVQGIGAELLKGEMKSPEWTLGERFNKETGMAEKFMYNKNNPAQMQDIGGQKADKVIADNLGGALTYRGEHSITPLGTVGKTVTPDALMTDTRARSEGDKNRGVTLRGQGITMRGQNMTDSRSRDTISQGNKPPAGYRYTADGNLEQIPGGPADIKTQTRLEGGGTVDNVVTGLRDMYNQLDESGGITNPDKSTLSNIPAGIASSGFGQAVGKMTGTQNQSRRNTIAQQRPLLLQAIMKATGMSAKQMDSNAELKLYLATATDPTLDVSANKRALDMIEKLYGSGSNQNRRAADAKPGGLSAQEQAELDQLRGRFKK